MKYILLTNIIIVFIITPIVHISFETTKNMYIKKTRLYNEKRNLVTNSFVSELKVRQPNIDKRKIRNPDISDTSRKKRLPATSGISNKSRQPDVSKAERNIK